MIYILYAYLSGSLIIIFWISFIRYVLLDEEDLNYSTDDLMMTYFMTGLFWPLLLFLKPGFILEGREIFRIDDDSISGIMQRQKQRLKELETIAEAPPLCGRVILYQHQYAHNEQEMPTDILFNSADIESHFKGKDLPLPNPEENYAIVAWIKNRDENHTTATLVPEQINFERMAIDLIENGYGEVKCTECNCYYPASLVIQHRPELHAGWNTESYRCPLGHELIRRNWIHINMRPK